MASTSTQPTAEQERAAAFLSLGFDTTQAFLLAATRAGGTHLEAADVRRMLEAGCSHQTAVRILL